MVVDMNDDWGIWCVHVAKSYLDKYNLEKNQREEWENHGPESYTSKN
jgi:hypothetical protein